jgi:hypothetical protein
MNVLVENTLYNFPLVASSAQVMVAANQNLAAGTQLPHTLNVANIAQDN